MGLPGIGTSDSWDCACDAQGTDPTNTGVQYVVSLNNLQGIVTLAASGGINVFSSGNTIYISTSGTAGLGTVTSVAASSSTSALTIGGSPVTTNGTLTFALSSALQSLGTLATAANKLPYTTASNVYATTDLTAFARTILDDANGAAVVATIGAQPHSTTLDDFVTNTSWAGSNLTLVGNFNADVITATTGVSTGYMFATGDISADGFSSTAGAVVAVSFDGDGSNLSGLTANAITAGTLTAPRGGTGFGSYTIGDILYANGANNLAKLVDVAAGSYLRSGGVATAPLWSTLKLPNAATTGDILYASSTNTIGNLADVATTNVLLSGGVGAAPSWGKVTLSHTTGIANSGTNSNIQAFTETITFNDDVTTNAGLSVNAGLNDSTLSGGSSGYLLSSTGTQVLWVNQLSISTITLSSYLNVPKTITAAGTTGAQTINKMSGSVNFAAAATSLVVTNSLVTANSVIIATVASNDATMKTVAAVATGGSFTLYANAGATAETRVNWFLTN